jgi:hypothetical protein
MEVHDILLCSTSTRNWAMDLRKGRFMEKPLFTVVYIGAPDSEYIAALNLRNPRSFAGNE